MRSEEIEHLGVYTNRVNLGAINSDNIDNMESVSAICIALRVQFQGVIRQCHLQLVVVQAIDSKQLRIESGSILDGCVTTSQTVMLIKQIHEILSVRNIHYITSISYYKRMFNCRRSQVVFYGHFGCATVLVVKVNFSQTSSEIEFWSD